jgi:hypothetical protein
MADMTSPQMNLISAVSRDMKIVLAMDGVFIQHDILNESYGKTITQAQIDAVPSFKQAGLTVAQFQAAVYALKMCHVALNADLTASVTVASL